MLLTGHEVLCLPDQNKAVVFKVGESVWSQVTHAVMLTSVSAENVLQPVSLDAPAADMRLAIPLHTRQAEEVHIGLSWSEGLGKYKQTKVLTLAPRFIVRNASRSVISFREVGSTPRGRANLSSGERAPLHFLRMGDDKLLTVAFPGLNAQWYVS